MVKTGHWPGVSPLQLCIRTSGKRGYSITDNLIPAAKNIGSVKTEPSWTALSSTRAHFRLFILVQNFLGSVREVELLLNILRVPLPEC